MNFIELRDLHKTYRTGKLEFAALRGVDLDFARGEMAAIVGPSGSGKSTLMNMITGIDAPTSGTVTVGGQPIHAMRQNALAAWRGRNVGIVFQFFQLLPTLTALENAVLPMHLARYQNGLPRREQARLNLETVGLGDKLGNLPAELSGGEQQRVAIARALACDPPLLIGDEPTGNLDTATANRMFELLTELNRQGRTVIYVTHDRELARRARRVIEVRDGRIVADSGRDA